MNVSDNKCVDILDGTSISDVSTALDSNPKSGSQKFGVQSGIFDSNKTWSTFRGVNDGVLIVIISVVMQVVVNPVVLLVVVTGQL